MGAKNATRITVAGQDVEITNPSKIFFPEQKRTKLDLVHYYLTVADAVLVGVRDRPMILKRYPDGIRGQPFYQKRAPEHRPDWIVTEQITFPSGRKADEIVCCDAAHLAWIINLGCIELHPWPVRTKDVDHADELRIDLDPTPKATFSDVRRVALEAREVLGEHGLQGFPKTSGSRGIHIYVRIRPKWGFTDVRHAALALAREVEQRMPGKATSAWWKEERVGVFIDYNQNARDRTMASAYCVRPVTDARVSCPLTWDEVMKASPDDFTMDSVPKRLSSKGDPSATIDHEAYSLESLLKLYKQQEEQGMPDAPLPPHFRKGNKEPVRAPPSKRKKRKLARA